MTPRSFALALALASTTLPSLAFAQVEGRCPTGFSAAQLRTPPGGPRPVEACANSTVEFAAMQLPQAVPADQEVELATQLVGGTGAHPDAPPVFRSVTVAGHVARITDFRATRQSPEGAAQVMGVSVALVPVGSGVLLARVISSEPATSPSAPVARNLLATLQGLDGSVAPARASATCPSGYESLENPNPTPNGMRYVLTCRSQGAQPRLIDVYESRLRVNSNTDARSDALFYSQILGRNGTATLDATRAVTFGSTPGFLTALHVTVPTPDGNTARLEMQVVVIPTATGHVQIVANAPDGSQSGLGADVTAFAINNLRTDGTSPPATAGTVAAGGDGGGAAPAPRPRRPQLDPSLPLWQPTPEGREDAGAEGGVAAGGASKGPCGCRTAGVASGGSRAVLVAWAWGTLAVLVARRRKRVA